MQHHSIFKASIGLACLLGATAHVEAQDVSLPAESLMTEMAGAYSRAQSYSDKSTALYRNRDGTERLKVDFRIWFARPESFRIDAESRNPGSGAMKREVLWRAGEFCRTWATGKAVSTHPKVKIAGSGLFGAYAYHIPSLLDPSYGARKRLHELTSVVVLADEAFEGVDCHHLRGKWEGDDYEIWMGRSDHLVRRIVAKYADHQLEEIHRDIVIDQPIPKEDFRFSPEDEVPTKKPAG
jgi:outer membrane lipoprotein-sorting protein